jgi:hypothetical protein
LALIVAGTPWARAGAPAASVSLDPAHTWTVIAGVLS